MSVYRHATADWGEILIEDGRDGRVFAKITDQRASGYHSITLPAEERQAAAQAVAGDRYRVVLISEYELTTDRPLEQAHEDLDRILDALGLDVTGRPYGPHECVTRDVLPAIKRLRGMINTLTYQGEALRAEVAELRGREAERCPACNHEPDRPEPVDPASVRVGQVVEIEADDGSWMVRGEVGRKMDDSTDWHLLIDADVWADDCIRPQLDIATVRILHAAEPEPDEAAVEALAEALNAVGGHAPAWPDLVPSNQEHYRARARALIRDHGVQVVSDDA